MYNRSKLNLPASALQLDFYILQTFKICLINKKDFLKEECKYSNLGGAFIAMMCKYM